MEDLEMLVLMRKSGQALQFTTSTGEVVNVKINNVGHGRVSVGIDAPKNVKVLRGELAKEVFPKGKAPTTESGNGCAARQCGKD